MRKRLLIIIRFGKSIFILDDMMSQKSVYEEMYGNL